jgi:N-acetylneuraminate synthase/N,N'-diacetyllegionaminate synthase
MESAISGSGIKEPSESEKKNISIVRKSLHYKSNFLLGHQLSKSDFLVLRPANGISPMQIDFILGKEIIRDVEARSPILINDLKQVNAE